jgi:serine protease AprX
MGEPIYLQRAVVEQLLFGSGHVRRFTQDSPVLPDVWIEYATDPAKKQEQVTRRSEDDSGALELLLTPFREAKTSDIRAALRERVAVRRIVHNQSTVLAVLTFEDLVRGVIPMTDWWARLSSKFDTGSLQKPEVRQHVANNLQDPEHPKALGRYPLPSDVLWMIRIVGGIQLTHEGTAIEEKYIKPPKDDEERKAATEKLWLPIVEAVARLLKGVAEYDHPEARIYSISLNRIARSTVSGSVLAVKGDAARQLFTVSCRDIRWAILDSGIDAAHPAFRIKRRKKKKNEKEIPEPPMDVDATPFADYDSRIRETYDFSNVQSILDANSVTLPPHLKRIAAGDAAKEAEFVKQIETANEGLAKGHSIDWALFAPLLRIPHDEHYLANQHVPSPALDHGTHVAGILGADWKKSDNGLDEDLRGLCPDIEMYDIRILDGKGNGDEFTVMAALQFVRWLNARNDYMTVHGVNMSLSIPHDVANYACGRTPVCDEAERTVSAGIVVVVAAGNQGYRTYTTPDGISASAYNTISITDPGNADMVITVGATHRARPHTYGVSYFSSRGPTGDGRMKPDLVAPGEKITATLPGAMSGLKDGTSMAAPHVSGAAAMLMARHNELVGRPMRIKEILCKTATDLGRERYFQGAGMLDILRAMQSV